MAGAAVLALASPTAISHPAKEAGAAAETAFSQGKKTRPREEGGEAQISCRRGLAGGRAAERAGLGADAAGPSQVTPRLPAWPGGGARGGGARALASAYKRASRTRPPDRAARAAAPPPAVLRCAAVSAPGHLKGFIHARFCSALPGVGGSRAQGFPTTGFFSRLFPSLPP